VPQARRDHGSRPRGSVPPDAEAWATAPRAIVDLENRTVEFGTVSELR